jgi:hypothetical protein
MRGDDDQRCHDAILKKPVIVVPDYEETRDGEECDPFGPPSSGDTNCIKLGLDAEIVDPETRESGVLFATGGVGDQIYRSQMDGRFDSAMLTCSLAGTTISLLTSGVGSLAVSIGCTAADNYANLNEVGNGDNSYQEHQGSFAGTNGYECSGACWSLSRSLVSETGSEGRRDQMSFTGMAEMQSCGEGRAYEHVAGTFLKGLAYDGPMGEDELDGGDATNRSGGHHYWGPGMAIRTEIPLRVSEDAPSCPQQTAE